jgi:Lon protease-like protein
MQQALLPLFPLQVVLFPRTPLPLHIFEDRYKEMIGDVLGADAEFGVVLARQKGIVNAGCTAAIERVLKRYPDGRMDIMTVGRRRFEIRSLDEEKSYLRGSVQFFEDDDSSPPSASVTTKALDFSKMLWDLEQTELPASSLSDPQPSFQLAQIIQDLDFRQLLLRIRSEAERMERLAEFLEGYLPRRRQISKVQRVAPLNGHGRSLDRQP